MNARAVVLVTGASKGIGASVALSFATAGYDVCVDYLSMCRVIRKLQMTYPMQNGLTSRQ